MSEFLDQFLRMEVKRNEVYLHVVGFLCYYMERY